MDHHEHEKVVEVVVDTVNGKVPVLAGTGSNSTKEAMTLTKAAKNAGADGALVISPYYNKPNRSGLLKHYRMLTSLDFPIVMYNVPGRTCQNMEPDLVVELAKEDMIVGIKEASGNINQIFRIIEETRSLDFKVLSGDDEMTFLIMTLGGMGVISVAANIEPKRMVALYEAFQKGDLEVARKLHFQLYPLFKAMFMDTNPIPVKKAVELRKMAAGPVRLPLDDLSPEMTARLQKVLDSYD
jgi:4-hydroxy-tetrahydrodipicolinate synthase